MSVTTYREGESDRVRLQLDEENSCVVALYGATVISYIASGQELIFVSNTAVYDNKKAIRGGIPIVFPNFGPWDLGPQHGFARTSMWAQENVEQVDGSVKVAFTLTDSEETRKIWNYQFKVTMSLTLSKSGLVQELTVDNTGENAFDFTTLLHTYFKCADIEHVSVEGLQGSGWTDKVLGDAPKSETRASLKLDGFYDSVYSQTPSTQTIKGLAGKDTPLVVDVEKTNLPDTVVWNPWEENAAKMGDFDDDGFHYMICVEAGAVSERTTLEPNSTWKGSQNIQPHA